MGSESVPPAFVSVVITVKNEAKNLGALLESLVVQPAPFEVVLVDALSHDRTMAIAEDYARKHPGVFRLFRKYGSRGIGRNEGVRQSSGAWVAFIDGACIADSGWLEQIRLGFRDSRVVAGKTVSVGPAQYGQLSRVELFQEGNDVTFPSCNLGYEKALFESLGGFDPRFITAEDIDLNLRAVQRGIHLRYVPEAIVYHSARPTILRFLYQAFWNGYGRKQLTEKHGSLWGRYRIRRLLSGQRSVLAWARLAAAFGGYVARVVTGGDKRLGPSGGAAS